MTKNTLWAVLALMLGAGGGAALRPVFDDPATPINPEFRLSRIALFEVACGEGETGPCLGLEVCGGVFANADAQEPIASGCFSEEAPPDDAGALDRLKAKGRAMLRQARATDAGLGQAHAPSRVVVFACEACEGAYDGGGGWGIEAADDLGAASAPLDDLPPVARKLAREFWPRKLAKDAGAPDAEGTAYTLNALDPLKRDAGAP